jgi:hypothetical protein
LGVSQPLRLLVESRVHGEELARFETLVVRGPGPDDCAIWVGAIGGDGYGRKRAELRLMQHSATKTMS